ncbi:MAG: DoxX family protein [Bacteroidales bacterium]|nr:DoxX family protein [Bacteroidales bacterium]
MAKTNTLIPETKATKILLIIARWFVGLVFLFSSFTKGVDPLGTAFKVEEYMTAWSFGSISFENFVPLAPFLSMALITMEFLVGILLITGAFRKLTAWLLALMMLFFTATTLYDAISNKVTDCGCFGDAYKLTNWQTFWKNIILDVPTLYIFLTRRWPRKRMLERDTLISLAAIAAMVIFGLYNINNEPIIDFRPWKVGNKMMDNIEEGLEPVSTVTYRNKATGETVTMNSKDLMTRSAEDSLWFQKWEWVNSDVISPYEIRDPKNDSVISCPINNADGGTVNEDGKDLTYDLIAATDGPVLICTIHHLDDINRRGIRAISEMKQMAADKKIRFVILAYCDVSPDSEDPNGEAEAMIQRFLYSNNLMTVEYYFGDEKAIETMLRSNPGFILMQNAEVKGKWHFRNVEKIKEFPFEEK